MQFMPSRETFPLWRRFLAPRLETDNGQVVFVQYLRGVAAMMVVWHHIFHAKLSLSTPLSNSNFGRAGVMIFFAISGFVLMHACRDEPVGPFLKRRAIRIVPLYWILTLVYFTILTVSDLRKGAPLDRFDELGLSLLFLPHRSGSVPEKIWPILVPGWTLNYEVFFFLVFGIGLALKRVALTVALLLLTLVAIGAATTSSNAILITWTDPVLLLFLGGMGVALLRQRFDLSSLWPMVFVGFGLVIGFALGILPFGWEDTILFAAALLCLIGALGLQDRFPNWKSTHLAAIGNASYSLYLLHTIMLIFVLRALNTVPLDGLAQFFLLAPVAFVLCVIGGLLCYRWVERPMLLAMRRWAHV